MAVRPTFGFDFYLMEVVFLISKKEAVMFFATTTNFTIDF